MSSIDCLDGDDPGDSIATRQLVESCRGFESPDWSRGGKNQILLQLSFSFGAMAELQLAAPKRIAACAPSGGFHSLDRNIWSSTEWLGFKPMQAFARIRLPTGSDQCASHISHRPDPWVAD